MKFLSKYINEFLTLLAASGIFYGTNIFAWVAMGYYTFTFLLVSFVALIVIYFLIFSENKNLIIEKMSGEGDVSYSRFFGIQITNLIGGSFFLYLYFVQGNVYEYVLAILYYLNVVSSSTFVLARKKLLK